MGPIAGAIFFVILLKVALTLIKSIKSSLKK
jgi:hypothetical protein